MLAASTSLRHSREAAPAGIPQLQLTAHLQNRGDVSRRHPQIGGSIGQRFIQSADGVQHAEYRIQPVLMHDADIGGQAAGNPCLLYTSDAADE